MSVPSIGGAGMNIARLTELYHQQLTEGTDATFGNSPAAKAASARSSDFASAISDGLQQVENLDKTASTKAIQAATGDLPDIQDYVIAATKAQTATELTTTIRNKALDSFNEIMRMSL
jgi:flagellar hook-basal body complex protein FliE